MPKIKFLPSEKNVEVEPGTGLVDAAQMAGLNIDIPCGGQGTCGKCKVKVVEGELSDKSTNHLTSQERTEGFILACKSDVLDEDVIIELPVRKIINDEIYEEIVKVDEHFDGTTVDALTKKVFLKIPQSQLDDGLSDLDRISIELKKIHHNKIINIPLSLIQTIPEVLRLDNGQITITLSVNNDKLDIIRIESGHNEDENFGIAIDIGTTTASIMLIDTVSGKVIKTFSTYNDQVLCGLDVISRINYAKNENRILDLKNRVTNSINRIIEKLCKVNEVSAEKITCAYISGNTVMVHLFLGILPEYIRLEPYTPAVLKSPMFYAKDTGVNINSNAVIHLAPCIGSYVGGDIAAGTICTGIVSGKSEVNLFIDIGTNGELVIGNNEFIITCACSAGPAFEGGGVESGMHASTGAIDKISVDQDTCRADYSVIGDVKPIGICGSAMIDLIAELFKKGWVDPSGKFNRNRKSSFIKIDEKRAVYIIADEDVTVEGPIVINEIDIENIMRAKAAIYSATSLVLEYAGMNFKDISKVYIAGGFGKYLNIRNGIVLGLLPDIPEEKFIYLGNASLIGASLALLSNKKFNLINETAHRMTYINLSNESGYMDQYMAALFIPHTDSDRFPSV